MESYAGQYVFKMGGRNFIVLNLEREDGQWTGTFARPQHADFGVSYSKISNESLTEPIVAGTMRDGHLHLIAAKPGKPSQTDELDLTVASSSAELKLSGSPLAPWHMIRVPGTPHQVVGAGWDYQCTYYPDELTQSNPEMEKIFAEDQEYRHSWAEFRAHEKLVAEQDKHHRQRVRKLLDRGALHSAPDFARAAFVFQHGETPDDYLLAHTLAIVAMALGDRNSSWIATATLDRYLQAIKQPQIYGTQMPPGTLNRPKEPYNRELVPDDLRQKLGLSNLRK